MQIEAQQSFNVEVAFAHAIESAMVLAIQCEDHADRELGDCIGRIGRDAPHLDSQPGGSLEVDLVETSTAKDDELGSALREMFERGGRKIVIHKCAYGFETSGEPDGFRSEALFEKHELMPLAIGRFAEKSFIVTLSAKNRDSHLVAMPHQNTGLVNAVNSGFLGSSTMSFLGVNAFSADRSRGELTAPRS
jgi:hypothetical protein